MFKKSNFPLYTTQEDINFLFELVRKSPYIVNNSDYYEKANDTTIILSNDEMVNAFAQSFTEKDHKITMMAGICNALKLISVGLAYYNQNPDKKSAAGRMALTCRWIGNEIRENSYSCDIKLISRGLEELSYSIDGIIAIDAKSYSAGGIISVIGHEQGHICLSHTLQNGEYSDEMSRNNERQADLFGCNVSVTTPFSSHIVLATLFCEILFSWMSTDRKIATTHPHSRERVYNTIKAHDVVLESLGITEKNIEWFLPKEEDIDDSENSSETETETETETEL